MGRPKGSKNGVRKDAKDKLDSLPEEFRDKIAKLSWAEINEQIAQITKLAEQNLKNKDEDKDLAAKKETAAEAGEQYKANGKAFRMMIQFCIRVQKDKGRPAGTFDPSDLDGKESAEAVNDAANGQ